MGKLGSEGLYIKTDVGEEEQVRDAVEKAAEHFGRIDILVNNAGIGIMGGTQDLSVADWQRVVDVNLKSVFMTRNYAMPHLKQSPTGRIINISSVHEFRGGGGPSYTPTKAGVVNLTRDTACEAGLDGITVNAILPGAIDTAMQDIAGEQVLEMARKVAPLNSLGKPRDIGRACVFLASDDAAWITGVALPVDGGLLCGWAQSFEFPEDSLSSEENRKWTPFG